MRRLKTGRRPPIYPKTPGHLPCSSLTHPLPLPSRRPSVSFGGFGLSHTALRIEGGEEELRVFYKKVLDSGTRIDFLTDHGLTRSIYLFDPDGNRLEVFYQVLHGEEAKQFMREGRAGVAPYELEPAAAS